MERLVRRRLGGVTERPFCLGGEMDREGERAGRRCRRLSSGDGDREREELV